MPRSGSWDVGAIKVRISESIEFIKLIDFKSLKIAKEETRRGLFFLARSYKGKENLIKYFSACRNLPIDPELWFYINKCLATEASAPASATSVDPQMVLLPNIPKNFLGLRAHSCKLNVQETKLFGQRLRELHSNSLPSCPHLSTPAFLPIQNPHPSVLNSLPLSAIKLLESFQQNVNLERLRIEKNFNTDNCNHFIHGDIKPENFFWKNTRDLALLDWECSGQGDWRWDVAATVSSILTFWIELLSIDASKNVLTEDIRGKEYDEAMLLATFFMHGYQLNSPKKMAEDDIFVINEYIVLWLISRGFSMVMAQQGGISPLALNFLVVAQGVSESRLECLECENE